MDPKKMAIIAAESALAKQAIDVEIIDVSSKVDYANYLVLCSAKVDRQVAAIAEEIQARMRKRGARPLSIEGMPAAAWVLIDFGDVIVHVFHQDMRAYYDIDSLWIDAERVDLSAGRVPSTVPPSS